jgi:hypothetical protein
MLPLKKHEIPAQLGGEEIKINLGIFLLCC